MIRLALLLVAPFIAASVPQSSQSAKLGEAVTSEEDIVVTGNVPRCWPRADDPQDAADLSASAGLRNQQLIWRDRSADRYALVSDHFPTADPARWQRAGVRLREFVFRVPEDGEKVCIGARSRFGGGKAQLRRAFDARPYWGKYVILTADVAARKAGRVDMWIAAGAEDNRPINDRDLGRNVVAGGFKHVPISGNFAWKRVRFLIGPLPCMAAQLSYGIQLQDGGDAWLARPRFVAVPEDKLSPTMRRLPHGAAMLRADPICRYRLAGAPLYEIRAGIASKLKPGAPVYPGMVLAADQGGTINYRTSSAPGLIEF